MNVTLDLARLRFTDAQGCPRSLFEIAPTMDVAFNVSWAGHTSEGLFRVGEPTTPADLKLELASVGGTRVEVQLVNRGLTPLRVCRRLDLGAERPLAIPNQANDTEGLVWSCHDISDAPLTAQDFVVLAPAAAVTSEFDLGDFCSVDSDFRGALVRFKAIWHCAIDGRHLGLEPAALGRLESNAVEVDVAGLRSEY